MSLSLLPRFNWKQEVEIVLTKRFGIVVSMIGIALVGIMAVPHDAKAWWRGGFGVGIVVPPVVVAPGPVYAPPAYAAPVYAPPPVAYYAPRRVWVPPHWEGPYWVRGHWG